MVPGFEGFKSVEGSSFFFEDGIGGLGPDEGLGVAVVAVEIVEDRALELGDAPEDDVCQTARNVDPLYRVRLSAVEARICRVFRRAGELSSGSGVMVLRAA